MVGMRQAGAYLAIAVLIAVTAAAGARADGPRNHLDDTDGPYLRLHIPDPVHWRRWGPEALAEAKALARPILLSIGYSACHYCHVMQKESFADAETAAIINGSFIAVIVDREERPDVDSMYQAAEALMGLPTGWPLTMFLTPGGEPFWGGTYFPKGGFGGMPPFKKILTEVAAVYREDPKGVAEGAAAAMAALKRLSAAVAGVITMKKVDAAAESFRADIDPFAGGFGDRSKFPWTKALEVLWRAGLRNDDRAHREAVTMSLRRMSEGGLYDHVGSGFFRYAVDPNWRVPHYEKMLDVNAALLGLMTEVWRETRDAALERKVHQTVAFLLREMRLPGGAFAGSLDADSLDGNGKEEEGAFYIWTPKAIDAALGADAALFRQFYAVGPNEDGEAESGALHRTDATRAAAAKELGIGTAAIGEKLEKARRRLRALRAKRHRPRRDEKVLADWNAMAVRALIEAGLAFGEAPWVAAGRRAFDFAARHLTGRDGRLRHWWERGRVGAVATLDDLAQMAGAALTLYEATGDPGYLKQAEAWADAAITHHWDGAGGGFFATAADGDPLVVRTKPMHDDPNPSGNAAMAEVLARLYFLSGKKERRQRAERVLTVFGGVADKPFLSVASMLNAADTLGTALQVVIIGDRREEGTRVLFGHTVGTSLPSRVLQVIGPGTVLPDGHPAQYKTQVDGKATAYVCRGMVCSLPATDTAELARTLAVMRQSLNNRGNNRGNNREK